jgi:hypothetical protein
LKLKIQLQTLIGSTIGVKFRSLEANKEQLRKYENSLVSGPIPYKQKSKNSRKLHNPMDDVARKPEAQTTIPKEEENL